MRVYDYTCLNGHVTEHFVSSWHEESVECPECGTAAMRQVSAPNFKLEGCSGDYPSAGLSWERKRNERMAVERKHKDNHGTEWLGKSAGYVPAK